MCVTSLVVANMCAKHDVKYLYYKQEAHVVYSCYTQKERLSSSI